MIPSRGHSEMKITGTIIRVVGLDTVVHIFKSQYLGSRSRKIVGERKVEWREERGDKRGRTKTAQCFPQPGVEG